MTAFIKFTRGDTSAYINGFQYKNGLNEVEDWNPQLKASGGFHFTTWYSNNWHDKATHVWDVTIPEGEHRINSSGCGTMKAASIIMSNCRLLIDILKGMPAEQQVGRMSTPIVKALSIPWTDEMRAVPQKFVKTVDGIQVYKNGLYLMPKSETGTRWYGMYTLDTTVSSLSVQKGTVFSVMDFRDGHAFGPGTWIMPSGHVYTGTFTYTMFNGPGTDAGNPCTHVWGHSYKID